MNKLPLVSIVLASYNLPEYFVIAFESLINQTWKNIEIIIADDCSTNPKNKELILEYKRKYPAVVQYIIQPQNAGIAKNKNTAYRMAKGDFICLLDGDDFYYPDKIACELELFRQHPEFDVVYSNFAFVDAAGKYKSPWATGKAPDGNIFQHIIQEDFPYSMLYNFELMRRSVFERYGYLDENFKMYEDWDLRIRYGKYCKVGYTGKIMSVYRRTGNSISMRTCLTERIDSRISVIEKNRKVFDQDPQLRKFYKSFIKRSRLEKLFDTSVDFKVFATYCSRILFKYPLNIMTVLRSVKYYFGTMASNNAK